MPRKKNGKREPGKESHILMLASHDYEKAQMVMGLNRAGKAGIVPEDTVEHTIRSHIR